MSNIAGALYRVTKIANDFMRLWRELPMLLQSLDHCYSSNASLSNPHYRHRLINSMNVYTNLAVWLLYWRFACMYCLYKISLSLLTACWDLKRWIEVCGQLCGVPIYWLKVYTLSYWIQDMTFDTLRCIYVLCIRERSHVSNGTLKPACRAYRSHVRCAGTS